jgi:hypothetical protein
MVAASAIGPQRTSLVAPHMCAFGGKADMPIEMRNVRYCDRRLIAACVTSFNG